MVRLALLGSTGTFVAAVAAIASPAVACVTPVQSLRDLHVVVIYEENHSFDNLYGGWGSVRGRPVKGRPAHWRQVDQAGNPITCLFQNDANLATSTQTVTWLDGTTHPGLLSPACAGALPNGGDA